MDLLRCEIEQQQRVSHIALVVVFIPSGRRAQPFHQRRLMHIAKPSVVPDGVARRLLRRLVEHRANLLEIPPALGGFPGRPPGSPYRRGGTAVISLILQPLLFPF